MEFPNVKTGKYAWKICIPFFWNTMQILEERIYLYWLRCAQITPIKLGLGLYIFINPCSFFHRKCICIYTYKAHKKLVSWSEKWNAHTKACIPFFQTLWAFSFLHFIFWNSCDHFYFILFYFIFPHDTWLLLSTGIIGRK